MGSPGRRWKMGASALGAAVLLLAAPPLACSRDRKGGGTADTSAESPHQALIERGRQVFQSHCTTCHSVDPRQPGPVGPAIAGSPLALLRTKVLHNEYPPGYKPQRQTHVMITFPQLEGELPAIAAYLDSLKK